MFKNPWFRLIVLVVVKISTLVFMRKALEYELKRTLKSNPDLKDEFFKKK